VTWNEYVIAHRKENPLDSVWICSRYHLNRLMKLRVMKQKEQLESRSFCFINIEKLRLHRNRLLRIHIYWSEPAETIRLEAVGDSEELIGKLPGNGSDIAIGDENTVD